eukprot:13123088-Heterocapsa_arctica.AAC.1
MPILRGDIPLAWATRPRARQNPSPELEWRYGVLCYLLYENGKPRDTGKIIKDKLPARSDTSASRARPRSSPYPPIPLAW